MKEIQINFTRPELLELCRQLYLAGFITAIAPDYKNEDFALALESKITAMGYLHFNEDGDFQPGGPGEPPFRLSDKTIEPLNEMFKDLDQYFITDYLSDMLTFSETEEKYGAFTPGEIMSNPSRMEEYKISHEKYKQAVCLNGVTNHDLKQDDSDQSG